MKSSSSPGGPPGKEGQPKGLYILFFTEMWERFGYYGMRALLVLYMINYLQWQPQASSSVYKWYTSLVYLTPLAGGYIADRMLGLRFSIIIGGALMAAGYFMLGVESLFYPALAFVIVGNGFFKPNISTMVGKMYKQGDARRDGAFTIFYMGINLGAFLSPLICGTLAATFAPKYGFMAAGVGMVVGLAVFLLGQARVTKDIEAAGNDLSVASKGPKADLGKTKGSEQEETREPGAVGFAGIVSKVFPMIMMGVGVFVPIYYVLQVVRGAAPLQDAIMPIAFAGISGAMGYTLTTIKGAARDRSTVIFVLFMFAVLFWMAFEQAGNALNIWADVHTDRQIGSFAYPASWWQSANAIFIVVLAPIYAALWVYLARTGKEPSTPTKMFLAMIFMVASFGTMVGGAASENARESRVALESLPPEIHVDDGALAWTGEKGEDSFLDAKRLTYDASKKELVVRGVLPPFVVNDALKRTTPSTWLKEVEKAEAAASKASDSAPVTMTLAVPRTFEPPFDDKEQKAHNLSIRQDGTFTFTAPLDAPTKTALVGAGAAPEWRGPLKSLEKKSWDARVSGFWLFLSYFLATLGELCLSPVGLSMVTKLAPARFASLFMGVWLLASSVAQYMGGAIGESWGKITPSSYFWIFVVTSIGGVVISAALIRPLRTLMHKVQ